MLWRQPEHDLEYQVLGEGTAQENQFAVGILGGSKAYPETHTGGIGSSNLKVILLTCHQSPVQPRQVVIAGPRGIKIERIGVLRAFCGCLRESSDRCSRNRSFLENSIDFESLSDA